MLKSILKSYSLNKLSVRQVIYYSQNLSVDISSKESLSNRSFVDKFLKKNPKVTRNSVELFYQNVKGYGFSVDIVPDMLKKCPDLVRIPSGRFEETLKCWLDINLGNDLVELITINPSVLFLSKKHLEERYKNLVQLYGKRQLGKIFILAPLVLSEPQNETKRKTDYLRDVLKYTENEIIKSGALNASYQKIKCRFEFMKRAGVFKVPNAKTLAVDKLANPLLSKILFLNDHDFSNQIVRVSLLEYRAFQELYADEEDSDIEDYGDSTVIDNE